MPDNKSVRILKGQKLEVRANDGAGPGITGYAAVFDVETDIGGMFRKKINQGAFTDALKNLMFMRFITMTMARCLEGLNPAHYAWQKINTD